ncbi:MAG: hypothetical protein ACREU6_16135 [Steroidobacteraceae bacterium]
MTLTVQFKNKNEDGDMKHSERAESRKSAAMERQITLALVDDHPLKERGYNPYNTIAHAGNSRERDVWRNTPKRA